MYITKITMGSLKKKKKKKKKNLDGLSPQWGGGLGLSPLFMFRGGGGGGFQISWTKSIQMFFFVPSLKNSKNPQVSSRFCSCFTSLHFTSLHFTSHHMY